MPKLTVFSKIIFLILLFSCVMYFIDRQSSLAILQNIGLLFFLILCFGMIVGFLKTIKK